MSPCSFFCPLPALLLHFPLLFFSITPFLKLADCSFGFVLQTASMICQSASAESNFGEGEKRVDQARALIRGRNPNKSLPSHQPTPKNKHNPPGISYFNVCGGKGMIHSFSQDNVCTVWYVCLLCIRDLCVDLYLQR